jgi:small subunit ribosomal protein S17
MSEKTKEAETKRASKRLLQGVVVSDKMQKTIVVKVDRRVQHGMYPKIVTLSDKYKAHDEKKAAKVGDRVEIVECRPLSRDKRWALRKVLDKAAI